MKKIVRNRRLAIVTAFVLVATVVGGGLVHADQFDAKIRQLENQNAVSQNLADQYTAQARNYQDAVDRLQHAIDSLQSYMDATQQQIDKLQKQIDEAQAEIDYNRKLLAQSILALYQTGQTSTFEVLASSTDLSDFVNREQYQTAVQDKVKSTFDKITALQLSLQDKQQQLKTVLGNLKQQEEAKAQAQNKESQLLAYSASQRDAYNNKIANNNSQIASLRAAQAAANASQFGNNLIAGDPNHGGYPAYLDNAYQDSISDPWGMLNRECVSYTAWKVQQTFGDMPYWGQVVANAKNWPADARAAGISTGSTPRVHSVAIWPIGTYGHAMWVEGVYNNGDTIHVSQYNYDYQGHYSEMTISSAGLTYIYFQ